MNYAYETKPELIVRLSDERAHYQVMLKLLERKLTYIPVTNPDRSFLEQERSMYMDEVADRCVRLSTLTERY